jgi:hypothetical protein
MTTVYITGALSHMHVFKWFRDSERDVRKLKMIQGVGSCQLVEIQKQLQKNMLVRDHQMTLKSMKH